MGILSGIIGSLKGAVSAEEDQLGRLECKGTDVDFKLDSGMVLKGLNLQVRGVVNESETAQNLAIVVREKG